MGSLMRPLWTAASCPENLVGTGTRPRVETIRALANRKPHFDVTGSKSYPRSGFRGLLVLAGVGLCASTMAAAAAEKALQLEVFFGGAPTGLIGTFRQDEQGDLDGKRRELEELGLVVPDRFGPNDDVPLAALPGVTYRYDEAGQALDIQAEPSRRRPKVYDAWGVTEPRPVDSSTTGLVLNYLIFGNAGGDRLGSFWRFQGASATLDARLFSPYGVISQTGILASNSGSSLVSERLRLDTTWTYKDPEEAYTARAGDTISGGLAWTRPIRLGGLQLQRDFAIRPDLVTLPLPSYGGSAAVPSTVDIYVNDVRTASQDVNAGPFRIDNLPILTGQGNASVVLRESSGRAVETVLPFFVSSKLLRAGLSDYSLEAGLPRLFYGARSNVYSAKPAGSASFRYGLTDRITLEAHAETTRQLLNGGIGASLGLDAIGLVSAAFAGSRYGSAMGGQLYAAFETHIHNVSLAASTRRALGRYVDLATVTPLETIPGGLGYLGGLPAFAPSAFLPGAFWSLRPPRALDQISVGIPVPFTKGAFNLGLIHENDYDGRRARIVTASYTGPLVGQSTLFMTGYADLGTSHNMGVGFGISIPLGPSVTATTGGGRDRSGAAVATDVVKPLSQELGSFGWRLRDLEGGNRFRSASAAYRADFGRVEASVNQTRSSTYGTIQTEGAVVAAANDVFLSNRIDESFAVVQTGVPDLEVLAENRPVARTNGNGKALVPTLKSYQKNKVSIDPSKLPLDASITTTQEVLTPPDRSGVTVDFGIKTNVRSAIVILEDPSGRMLQAGARGRTENGHSFVVGYDGRAYIEGLEPTNVAVVSLPDRDCRTEFTYEPSVGDQVVIGPVTCR